jgi:hypothetical protein
MKRRIALFALAAFLASPIAARAADPVPMPNAAETAFITGVQADLNRRFPTTAAAERAGYVRYTNEDNTGAISYANNKWVSASPRDPSQLWYDVNGRLLGADYSVLQANNPTPPSFFGVDASRFSKTPTHVHYVIKNPDGTLVYSKAVRTSKWLDSGNTLTKIDAAGLVKTGAVTSADQVATIFLVPDIWDFTVWVLPNPAGAFADANPNVIPVRKPATPAPGMIH